MAGVTVSLVLLATTGLAFLLPWNRLPGWATVLVPLAYTGSALALTLAAGRHLRRGHRAAGPAHLDGPCSTTGGSMRAW